MIGLQSLEAWKGTILVEDYEDCLLFKSCSEVIVFTDKARTKSPPWRCGRRNHHSPHAKILESVTSEKEGAFVEFLGEHSWMEKSALRVLF